MPPKLTGPRLMQARAIGHIMTHRNAARLAGMLFLCATIPFSIAVALLAPILENPEYLVAVSQNSGRVSLGVMLELMNHAAVVGIAVVLYPIFKPFSHRLAVGYVAARSIESVLFVIGTMHILVLIGLSQDFVALGAPSDPSFHTLGGLLLDGHNWDKAPFAFLAFGIGALILNYALFTTRLVPRWLSGFGLLAGASILGARLLLLTGVGLSTPTVTALDSPIMLQEMVFAVWLIAKGFDATHLEDTTAPTSPNA